MPRSGVAQPGSTSEAANVTSVNSGRSIFWIPVIFLLATSGLYFLSANCPQSPASVNGTNNSTLKFPSSLEDLTVLSSFLKTYKGDYFEYVFTLFCSAYLYKQTFAVPGSVFLNILAGAIYGTAQGFPLVCFLSGLGATFCFLLSHTFGRGTLVHYFPDRIKFFQTKICDNWDGLFFYLLFLRLFPMSPNWFMNMAAPIVGVPAHLFFLSVFTGLMPYNLICVRTGVMLSEITSLNDVFSWSTMLQLLVLALVALLPAVVIKRVQLSRQEAKQKAQ